MIALQDAVGDRDLPLSAAAKRLGLPRSRFDELRRGRVSQSGLDELVELADKAGLRIEVRLGAGAE